MEETKLRADADESLDGKVQLEVIIPTLNEGQSIGDVIREIRNLKVPFKVSISVVDGGSSDNTIDICNNECVNIVTQKGKGKGSALRQAVKQSKGDILVFIDGDGTYPCSAIPALLEPLSNNPSVMAVGSRLINNSEKGSITLLNMIGNRLFNWMINFALKSSVTDSLSGFRALYRKSFNELVLFSDNFDIEVEMTVEALTKGYTLVEIPVSYRKRKGSKTKLNPFKDGTRIARTLFFILMNANPLKFFSTISIIFFGIGIYPAVQVLYEKVSFGMIESMPSTIFASLLFMTGTICLLVGLVSDLVVRSRRRLEYLIQHKDARIYWP